MSSTAIAESFTGRSRRGEPVWELAMNYPLQGDWTEEEYLALETNRLVEFSDGFLEFLPMPSLIHQLIADFLHGLPGFEVSVSAVFAAADAETN